MASDAAVSPAAGTSGPVRAGRPGARRPRAVALVLAGYVAAAFAVTWHLWAGPARLAVAGNPWDADLFAWYLRYTAAALAHGHLPALITTSLNAPRGVSMMWNTAVLLPGIVLAPVTLLAGPQASLTLMQTAGFAGSAASLMLVLRRWRLRTGPAAIAGAVYGFSPALVQSAIGHYDLQFAVLPPLLIDAGLRLFAVPAPGPPGSPPRVTRPGPARAARTGILLGLLAAAQLFVAEETLAISAVTGALLGLGLILARPAGLVRWALAACRAGAGQPSGPRRRTAGSRLAAAAGRLAAPAAGAATACGAFLAVAGIALATQFTGPLAQHGSPFYPDYYKNDLTVFTDPSGYVIWHSSASAYAASWLPGGAPEQLGYLGWPMIAVLAAGTVALWRDRRVRVLAVLVAGYELLSLGGHPEIHGVTDPRVTLPWHWVEGWPLLGLALPDRLSIFADGMAAVLLAVFLDRTSAGGPARPLPEPAGGAPAAAGSAGHLRVPAAGGRPAAPWLGLARAALIAAAVAPLVPLPLPAAAVPSVPAGWAAAFAALRLPPAARVLAVPVPNAGLTEAMRWQATTGTDISLIGGYFLGPAAGGQAYVDGQGSRPTANYLDWLWLRTPAGRGAPTGPVTPVARPSLPVVRADLAWWRAAAVVADTTPGTALGRYLTGILGPPAVTAGSVMAWRLG